MSSELLKTSKLWDSSARTYAKNVSKSLLNLSSLLLLLRKVDELWPFLEATSILDNGCGPAPVMRRIIELYGTSLPATTKLICADFSRAMIEEVEKQRTNASPNSSWKRTEAIVQDATNMTAIKDDSQSHVVANMVYFMTPDPDKAMSESWRVLQSGGVLGVTSASDAQWWEIMVAGDRAVGRAESRFIRDDWRSKEGIEGYFQRAGFCDIEVEFVEAVVEVESHEKQMEFMLNVPNMKEIAETLDEEKLDRWKVAMTRKLKELCPTVPSVLTGNMLVGVGRKDTAKV